MKIGPPVVWPAADSDYPPIAGQRSIEYPQHVLRAMNQKLESSGSSTAMERPMVTKLAQAYTHTCQKTKTNHYPSAQYSPVCRPLRFASLRRVTRARLWMTTDFFMIRPSLYNFWTFRREFASAISLISLGSNQTLRLPHFRTSAARRFCSLRETKMGERDNVGESRFPWISHSPL